jgi:hypothetical protein
MDKKLLKNTASDIREVTEQLITFMSKYEKEALSKCFRLVKIMGPRREPRVLLQVVKEISYTETIPLVGHVCTSLDMFINLHLQADNLGSPIFTQPQLNLIKSLKNKFENYNNYMQTATAAKNFQNLLLSNRLE